MQSTDTLAPYLKAAVALIVGVVGWGIALVVSDSDTDTFGWIMLATAAVTSLAVYLAPNDITPQVNQAVAEVYEEIDADDYAGYLPEDEG